MYKISYFFRGVIIMTGWLLCLLILQQYRLLMASLLAENKNNYKTSLSGFGRFLQMLKGFFICPDLCTRVRVRSREEMLLGNLLSRRCGSP